MKEVKKLLKRKVKQLLRSTDTELNKQSYLYIPYLLAIQEYEDKKRERKERRKDDPWKTENR